MERLKRRVTGDVVLTLGYFLAGFLLTPTLSFLLQLRCATTGYCGGFEIDIVSVILTLIVFLLHEFVHYAVARALGIEARIRTYLRAGALIVLYKGRVVWWKNVVVLVAPFIAIQPPLTALVTVEIPRHISDALVFACICHFLGSMPDLVEAVGTVLMRKGCYFELMLDDKGRVIGWFEFCDDIRYEVRIKPQYLYAALALGATLSICMCVILR